MIVLRFVSGGIAWNRRNTSQRSGQGSQTAAWTPACRARAALDGENGVVRWREQQGRPSTHSTASTASGARRPKGPEVSGIKAEWPRFGTRRGALPASPTAATPGRQIVS